MFGLRLLWRDWRGGELGILAAAIVIAVAIVTGISLFADRLQQAIQAQSSHFLAADRVLQSPRPIQPRWLLRSQALGLQTAEVAHFQSMVFASEAEDSTMQLASVKAVSSSYPLRGTLVVSDVAFGAAAAIAGAPKPGEAWLDSRLLPLLELSMGDVLYVGEARLRIARVVISEPDRGSSFNSFGPRVLINSADIAATNIIQPGSRVEYRYLFAGEAPVLERYGQWLQPQLLPGQKWLGLKDSQPRIAQSLQRAEQFLLLAGSLGVGLAGIAIALAARRYSERHYDYVAMMKTLGASAARIMSIYSLNLLLLALISTLAGCLIGWLIQYLFILILQDYFSLAAVPAITLRPFLLGGITALVCLLAFALPPLASLLAITPLRVLRRDIQQQGVNAVISYGLGLAGIGLLMLWYSANLKLTLAVLAGVGLTFIVIGGAAWYLLRGATTVGMQAGSIWRLALASMRRRGFQNSVQAVIFSLAIMLLLMLVLLRSSLIEDWKVQLPAGTPNHFLINVAASEVNAVASMLDQQQLLAETIYPIVRGRLTRINNQPVNSLTIGSDSSRSGQSDSLDRELSMTWSASLPAANKLVAGQWWNSESQRAELSIEQGLAQQLGVNLGDQLQFQIGSEVLVVSVSSIRSLHWDSMRPNFFMIFPPELLRQYPATYITSFYLPEEKKQFLNQFLRRFPTITVLEMDAVIKQIRSIINQVSRAVELVLGLIIISGLLVLVATVQASLDSRFQESAILRTLGASRALVLGSLAIEFAALGLLAGLLAAFSAEVAVFGLQQYVLDMEYTAHPWVWLAGPVLGALLIGSAGYFTCRKVVSRPPVQVLAQL